MPKLIAPSLLSADFTRLAEEVRAVDAKPIQQCLQVVREELEAVRRRCRGRAAVAPGVVAQHTEG